MAQSYTLHELASLVDGEVSGNGEMVIKGLNGIDQATDEEITFVTNHKMAGFLDDCKAAACIVPADMEELSIPSVRVLNPDLAAAIIHNHLLRQPYVAQGVHQAAVIGNSCSVPDDVTIGPMVCIGDRVRIGHRVTVYPGVVIGDEAVIGDDTILHANVSIAERCVIGRRVILYAGVVIGSDGFGYATDQKGGHVKKPQIGNVQIDDDVEIGANSCVDRAAFGTTRVRSGAKIDNLVMVAHNVDIGENSILIGQVGIAGSTTLGRNVVLGGMAGVGGHLSIGNRVMVAGMSGVHSNLKDGEIVGGAPAFDVKKWGRATAAFARLPEMVKEIRRLRREVDRLDQLLTGSDKE